MRWSSYEKKFRSLAETQGVPQDKVDNWLKYANNLFQKELPIIFDQTHLALLLGIDNEYLHSMSNAPEHFYRTFYINSGSGWSVAVSGSEKIREKEMINNTAA